MSPAYLHDSGHSIGVSEVYMLMNICVTSLRMLNYKGVDESGL